MFWLFGGSMCIHDWAARAGLLSFLIRETLESFLYVGWIEALMTSWYSSTHHLVYLDVHLLLSLYQLVYKDHTQAPAGF